MEQSSIQEAIRDGLSVVGTRRERPPVTQRPVKGPLKSRLTVQKAMSTCSKAREMTGAYLCGKPAGLDIHPTQARQSLYTYARSQTARRVPASRGNNVGEPETFSTLCSRSLRSLGAVFMVQAGHRAGCLSPKVPKVTDHTSRPDPALSDNLQSK